MSSDFLFFSAFLDLQSIRDDEATTPKELIFLNALTDVPITSLKTRVEVANSGIYESIRVFPKISENSRFRSFKLPIIRKDSAVPDTSNNQGLTVNSILDIYNINGFHFS